MKRIFINEDHLDICDLDYEIIRVKGILINDNHEALIAKNNNTYQFLGGHIEKDEDMEEALIREIKEESGIDIDSVEGPFMQITTYSKNYFNSGKNVCSKIYYYRVFNNCPPNLLETNYDELEKQTEFRLFYIKMEDLENFLTNSIENRTIDANIGREMLLVLEEYNKLFERDV